MVGVWRALAAVFALGPCAPAVASWQYQADEDKMTGRTNYLSWIESTQSLDLQFPYRGRNHGTLIVRRHPRTGLNVVFKIDKGQLMCNGYDGCNLLVRFDDAPPITMSATGAADNSPEVAFIQNTSRFVAAAKKAKRIRVSFNVYQNGTQVLEFIAPTPLEDWPKPGTK